MKVELKEIIDQLTDAICLNEGYKVSACVDEETNRIVGWIVVKVSDDGTITPMFGEKFNTLNELFDFYGVKPCR